MFFFFFFFNWTTTPPSQTIRNNYQCDLLINYVKRIAAIDWVGRDRWAGQLKNFWYTFAVTASRRKSRVSTDQTIVCRLLNPSTPAICLLTCTHSHTACAYTSSTAARLAIYGESTLSSVGHITGSVWEITRFRTSVKPLTYRFTELCSESFSDWKALSLISMHEPTYHRHEMVFFSDFYAHD